MYIHYIIINERSSENIGAYLHKHLNYLLYLLSCSKYIVTQISLELGDIDKSSKYIREDYWQQKFKLRYPDVPLMFNKNFNSVDLYNRSDNRSTLIIKNTIHIFNKLRLITPLNMEIFPDNVNHNFIYNEEFKNYTYNSYEHGTTVNITDIVPFTDEETIDQCLLSDQLSLFKVGMADNIDEFVMPVLQSGYITQGKKVKEFEQALSEFLDTPYVLTVNAATSGIMLACRLLNLDDKSEIISTPLTCVATNFPILNFNSHIVWADIDPETCNIDLNSIKSKLTPSTRAIMIVHWGGYPIDLDKLKEIQDYAEDKYGFRPAVIEDCAHAFGSKYKGKYLGNHNNICIYSFQAIKHLTCSDGGAIILPNKEMYERAKLLRWFGIDREQRSSGTDFRLEKDISEFGYKFHMNDVMASIGLANMQNINHYLEKTRHNVKRLKEGLKDVTLISHLKEEDGYLSSYWLYTIKIYDKHAFIRYMKNCNIMVSQVHRRNDVHSCLSTSRTSLPQLDELESKIICIPCGWWLSDIQIDYIINCIKEWPVNHLTYKELESNDFEDYIKLLGELTQYSYNLNKEIFENRLKNIKSQQAKIYVVIYQNKIIGSCKVLCEVKFGDPVIHLEDVVVTENFRRFGIGKELIRMVKGYANEKGAYKIILDAKDKLDKFYTYCGFKREGNLYTYRLINWNNREI